MQNDIMASLEVFSNVLVPLILALASCIAKIAKDGWHGFREFAQNFIIGSFVGVLVYWGMDYYDFSPTVKAAITGGCIYVSKDILTALQEKIVTSIKDWHGREKRGDNE